MIRARGIKGWLARIAAVVIALPLLYFVAALACSLIPDNAGRVPPAEGIRIYVADNGIHTDLILPAADWRDVFPAGDLADPRYAALPYVAFGWGDRDFYLNTPSWDRMSPSRAVAALTGAGPAVLHIAHVGDPTGVPEVRAVLLRPEEYRRLAAFVRATAVTGADRRATGVHGYGGYDAFYPATGRYNAFTTCNEWTGRALRTAGVRMGIWTPLPISVMSWL